MFAFVSDGNGGAAVTNVPLLVEGGSAAPAAKARVAKLPLELLPENGNAAPYIASGYMGNTSAIKMSESTDSPHGGQNSTRVDYSAAGNWGGMVWQSPANDWGEKPGGFNLTGARKLSFWARGETGGEKVSFSFGLLDKAKYADSAKGEIKDAELSKEWKQFTIDLSGKDLKQIKTGFTWVLGAKGDPITLRATNCWQRRPSRPMAGKPWKRLFDCRQATRRFACGLRRMRV